MIHRNEIDVAISAFIATLSRSEAADFSPILYYSEYGHILIDTLLLEVILLALVFSSSFKEEIWVEYFPSSVASDKRHGLLALHLSSQFLWSLLSFT